MRLSANTSPGSTDSPLSVTDVTSSAMRSRNVLSPALAPNWIVDVETKVVSPCVRSRSTL